MAQMDGVTEYSEDLPVKLEQHNQRWVISALNEGGCNGTMVDVLQLVEWLRKNRPDLLPPPGGTMSGGDARELSVTQLDASLITAGAADLTVLKQEKDGE